MSGAVTQQAVTANRLGDGIVVWLGPAGDWVETLAEAALVEPAQAEAALALGKADERACRVVDAYLIEVAREKGQIRPLRYREVVRALGPSVRPDLGKQSDLGKQATQPASLGKDAA